LTLTWRVDQRGSSQIDDIAKDHKFKEVEVPRGDLPSMAPSI